MASLLLLHTCESDGTAEANAEYLVRIGAEPHWVFDPRFGLDEAIQMLPYTQAGKALRNLAGGVETNRREQDKAAGVDIIQVELVGYADRVAGYDDAWYAHLRAFIAEICAATGVPHIFPRRFATRYGDDVRYTPGEWNDPALRGVIGHCHAPENDHWDPGPLDVARLQPTTPAPTHTEDDMQWRILAPAGSTAKFIAPMSPLPDGTLAALYCIWLPTGDKVDEYARRGVTELGIGVEDLRNVALLGEIPHGDTREWSAADFLTAA